MCTAISYKTKAHYFGRNLDLDYHYNETVVITPRNYCFQFCNGKTTRKHFAMIGMATVANNYPLYYEATNECGLSIAGLNFPEYAAYLPFEDKQENIAPYEFIPRLLCQCETVRDALCALKNINLANIPFSKKYGVTPLHWLISDSTSSITVEPRSDGLHIYKNQAGVLTNSPPFDYHINNLSNYLNLTAKEPINRFSNTMKLQTYSRGMGGIGLPGDLSSASRFVKVAFTKLNSVSGESEVESVSQFFHILKSVEQQRGCVNVGDGYEITVYSSCCNTDAGIYYYTTYENNQISAVSLYAENLDTSDLYVYPLIENQQIKQIN